MTAPISPDLRRRFKGLILSGMSARAAARQLLLSPASGVRLAAKIRRGESLEPAKCGRPEGQGKLAPYRAFFVELVEQDPDITLMELRSALIEAEGVRVNCASIFRLLRRLGYTYKKSRWWPASAARPM